MPDHVQSRFAAETSRAAAQTLDPEDARVHLAGWLARPGLPVHAMLLGLGRFETVNLAYGKPTGDAALDEIERRVLHFARDEFELEDVLVSRLSGGTFFLAARGACSRERWQWLAEALADAVGIPIRPGGDCPPIRLAARIALIRAIEGDHARPVLEWLGATLRMANGDPGLRIVWVDRADMPPGVDAARLETDLLPALEADQISILYQPQYDCRTGRVAGAEALARWDHPEFGAIGAATLFTIAERTDQTAQLTHLIVRKALAEARAWPQGGDLSINVTPIDLAYPGFARQLLEQVDRCDFPVERLIVEITEQVLVGDLALAADTLGQLRAAGLRIALDDFGAGFCNFRYLKILPVDYLKLDRQMVEGIAQDPRDLAVLRAIVAMARALDLAVIAEGIESEGQRAIVSQEGCAKWQGFLGAEPMTGAQFAVLPG